MIIKTLAENTASSPGFIKEFGLSLYIETKSHKILFDLGSSGIFLNNAQKLGVNIADVDTVIISHGHYDHGGALKKLLENNKKAKVYLHSTAFEPHYFKFIIHKNVGLDPALKDNERIVLNDNLLAIDDQLVLFSDVTERILPPSNKFLFIKKDGKFKQDDFKHEQNLIITENDTCMLVSGCSHTGIVNILNKAEQICGRELDFVIGGFHLSLPMGKSENDKLVSSIAKALKDKQTHYYTCHCTGLKPYKTLQALMGEQIEYLSTGDCIEI